MRPRAASPLKNLSPKLEPVLKRRTGFFFGPRGPERLEREHIKLEAPGNRKLDEFKALIRSPYLCARVSQRLRPKMLRHVVWLQTLSVAAPIALREKQRVVGIIGSGVAGASTAHFLRELRPDLRVVVWERDAIVGGRARTADLGGRRVDLGATPISTLNQYLLSFTTGMRRANGNGSSTLGIYDGAGFRFRSREGALPLAAHLTARYGPSWLKVLPMVKATASNLSRIYDLQRRGVAFRTPASLLEALGLYELTQVSAYDYFRFLPRAFVEEFIDGASSDNYGQDGSLNAFADLVSLAGAGLAGDVFMLEGGTAEIPQSLLASSGA